VHQYLAQLHLDQVQHFSISLSSAIFSHERPINQLALEKKPQGNGGKRPVRSRKSKLAAVISAVNTKPHHTSTLYSLLPLIVAATAPDSEVQQKRGKKKKKQTKLGEEEENKLVPGHRGAKLRTPLSHLLEINQLEIEMQMGPGNLETRSNFLS